MSCVSTDLTREQKTVLRAFQEVYDFYKMDFILEDAQTYMVTEGDTLAAITRRTYGAENGYFFPLIALAFSGNPALLTDVLEPGLKLTIPNLNKNLNNPDARQSLKYLLYAIADIYEKKENAETREYEKQEAAAQKTRLRSQADAL
jgi:hypothetical protein